MILIPVDEGYAYDVLAICKVKILKNLKNAEENYRSINESLNKQLNECHIRILQSEEYVNLINANLETFEAVEKARYGEISAKEVDDLNMKRFYCKQKLQKKFFPDLQYIESKS